MLGAVVGSFIATLVVRWPGGRTLGGRSACDRCGRTLRVRELIPLLSYVLQKGRCRDCGRSIDAVHPMVEMLCAAVGFVALLVTPAVEGFWGAAFGWLLVALAIIDLRHFWLPDRLTATLAGLGAAAGLAGQEPPLIDRATGGIAGFAALWLIALAYRRLRGRDGLGGGDPKLMGAVGLWTGWQALPLVLLGASGAGLAAALTMALLGRQVSATTRLPLGTFIALAAFAVWIVSR